MKIFLICPVRNITNEFRQAIETQVAFLESQGHQVYYPTRDTNQSNSSIEICNDNCFAIQNADIVYIIWDGKSQGCLFDLGVAFALAKPIHTIIGYTPPKSSEKSFQNLMYEWEELKTVPKKI
jgi:nucleoside 2-deoxyribosyltransferase